VSRANTIQDFLGFVAASEDGECWPWTGSLDPKGYGVHWQSGRGTRAHRLMFALHFGPIPSGLVIRHSCDNRRCVRPAHLLLGTQAENVADMDRRGRRNPARGATNGKSKLTADAVLAIRASDLPYSRLARAFGITKGHVANVKARRVWGHL